MKRLPPRSTRTDTLFPYTTLFRSAVPDNDLVSAGMFNQVFTLHGTVMMFLFAVPIFAAVAIRLLPDMMGARDLPFPPLSAYGFWCFLIGGAFVCVSILFAPAPGGGRVMYHPLTPAPHPPRPGPP